MDPARYLVAPSTQFNNNITTTIIIIFYSRRARFTLLLFQLEIIFFRSREPVQRCSYDICACAVRLLYVYSYVVHGVVFRYGDLQSSSSSSTDTISCYYLLLVIFSTWLRDDDDDIFPCILCFIKTFYTNFKPTIVFFFFFYLKPNYLKCTYV